MATRSIGSGRIAFGLVTMPVKLYTATSAKSVSFNMLHKCGSRVKQQLLCEKENVVIVDRSAETVKGFEYATDSFVQFTKEELEELETDRTGVLTIESFVPEDTVDLTYIQKTYFLGPDKGGAQSYQLLAQAMKRAGRVAVGRFARRGKDDLVLVRPYKDGLILHESFYADEVYRFEEIDIGGEFTFKDGELQLADALIAQLSNDAFDPSKYHDTWAKTVADAVASKVAGEAIVVREEAPKAQILDLLEALKMSVGASSNHNSAPPAKAKGPKKAEQREQNEQPAKKKRAAKG